MRQTPSNHSGPLPPHAIAAARRRSWRWLERLLLAIGVLCMGYYGYVTAEAYVYQAYETRELDAILWSAPSASPASASPVRQRSEPAPGTTIGRIDIPR